MGKSQTGSMKPPPHRVRRIPAWKKIPMMQAANRLPPPLPFPFLHLPSELRLLIYRFVWTIDPTPHLVPFHEGQLKPTYLHAQLLSIAHLGRISAQIRREAYAAFWGHTQVYLRWDIKDLTRRMVSFDIKTRTEEGESWEIGNVNGMKLVNLAGPLLRGHVRHVVWYWGFYGRVMMPGWRLGTSEGMWVWRQGPVTFGPHPDSLVRGGKRGKRGGKSVRGVEALERWLVDLAGQGQLETLEVVWDFKGERVCKFLRRERRLLEVLERVVDASSGSGSGSGSAGEIGGEKGQKKGKGKGTSRTGTENGERRRRERIRVSLRVEAREGEKFETEKTEDFWEYLRKEESEVWERLERVVTRRDNPEMNEERLFNGNGVAIHQHLGALNPL